MTLACLCVLVKAQIPSVKISLVPAMEPKEVTTPAADGEAITLNDLSAVVGLPTKKWAFTGWIFIESSPSAFMLLVKIADKGQTLIQLLWVLAASPVFSDGFWSHFKAGLYPRVSQQWFHLSMGSVDGTCFGVVTLRGSAGQIDTTWDAPLALTSTTSITAPVNDPDFHVIAN